MQALFSCKLPWLSCVQALASSSVLLSFLAAYDRESILSLFHGVESRCASLPLTEALSDLLVGNEVYPIAVFPMQSVATSFFSL